MRPTIRKIVSGGQTGVDRGALDAALALGIPHGGWCPRGRRAEDGRIPRRYALVETRSSTYPVRTRRNVTDSDATLVVTIGRPRDGTALTCTLARKLGKPLFVVDLATPPPLADVRRWLRTHEVATLNVAGPRASTHPGIARRAETFLVAVLAGRRRAHEVATRPSAR